MNKIICGDALEKLKEIESGSVDCCITSPPYNKGYFGKRTASKHDVWKQRNIDYGDFKDNLEWEEYQEQQKNILKELVRIIKPKGSIFYNHKGQPHKHKLYFPEWVFNFNLRQILIWDRGSTPILAPIRWFPTTEYIFWITKTNIQPKFYKRSKHQLEIVRIPPKPMKEHPAPFPEELVETLMINTTDEKDLVLDPFMGSGTTGVACKKLKRNFIGIEISEEYYKIAEQRINSIPEPMI
jgi:modification methylase